MQLGFSVIEACDGVQALERLSSAKRAKRPITAIFLDLNMVSNEIRISIQANETLSV